MKKSILGKVYDKAFVPALIAGLSLMCCAIYNKGRSDCIEEIYDRGWGVVDLNEDDDED